VLPVLAVYPLLVASRCVFALVGSGTGPASQAYIAERTGPAERAAGLAMVSAAVGLGETLGPALGAALATFGLVAPIYFVAGLAAASALGIWFRLPEDGPPHASKASVPRRIGYADRRVAPFLAIVAALQAVRATTVITFALFLQDSFALTAAQAAQRAGMGFVALAASGLVAQLLLVQRLRPTARAMILWGVPLVLLAFVLLVAAANLWMTLGALAALGLVLGLVRPGSAAGASLAVRADEQGAVAGLLGGLSVLGNVFGPMLGTTLYALSPRAPYLLNAVIMTVVLVGVLATRRIRGMRS
jgi:MFS family permease